MQGNQNHRLLGSFMCSTSWYCDSFNTRVDKVIMLVLQVSCVLTVISIFPLLFCIAHTNYNKIKGNVHSNFPVRFFTILFCLGLLGCITSIVGHGLYYYIVGGNQAADIEQESYELSSNNNITTLPSYGELHFSDEPPSYEEVSTVNVQQNYIRE